MYNPPKNGVQEKIMTDNKEKFVGNNCLTNEIHFNTSKVDYIVF